MTERDLFGHKPAKLADPNGLVAIPLSAHVHGETEHAWLLSKTPSRAGAKHAPKSKVTRGVGRDINVFTMPRWLASEKGWL